MLEQNPITPDIENQDAWQPDLLGDALDSTPQEVRDGYRLDVAGGALSVEIDGEAGMVQLTTRHAHILLHNMAPPRVRGEVVSFSSASDPDELQVFVTAAGLVAFKANPRMAPEATGLPRAADSLPKRPGTHLDTNTAKSELGEAPMEGDSTAARPAQSEGKYAQPEKQERVDLVGRIVEQPSYKRTKRKRLVGEFGLEIETDDGETVTKSIVVFSEEAAKLRKALSDVADEDEIKARVIGYPKEREVRAVDGSTGTVKEIYAARVFLRE